MCDSCRLFQDLVNLKEAHGTVYEAKSISDYGRTKFTGHEQEDAEDFVRTLILELKVEFSKMFTDNAIKDIFLCQMQEFTVCSACNNTSSAKNLTDLYVLPVHINAKGLNSEGVVSLETALKNDTLASENLADYTCNNISCQMRGVCIKHKNIVKLPSVLILQLVRFRTDTRKRQNGEVLFHQWKVTDTVRFNIDLEINVQRTEVNHMDTVNFELRGVVVHEGPAIHNGHYKAYVKVSICTGLITVSCSLCLTDYERCSL